MENLGIDFFVDKNVTLTLGGRSLQEAQGHLVLLGGSNESFLKVACLLDGNTIDFIFGVKRNEETPLRMKVNNVKKFIRSLDTSGREAIADFYYVVFQAMTKYHKAVSLPCSWIFCGSLEYTLHTEIEEAYECLKGIISEANIISDDE